ncbi:type I DNA topoisomerase [Clostridia bacterium]|nr:type I DNA topoisomerase [Clostridia bacterium]
MADKILVIVESPAKAKTINKFLGSRYLVTSSMGHVIDLPKSKMGVDVENNFEPQYITIRGKGNLLKEIKKQAKKAKKILVATDPDREGEAIAWHLQRVLGLPEDSKTRIEFNEITKDAILEAVKQPRTIDMHRVEAQQARRVLDRLVGYSLSPLLWKKVKKGLSAGRVQSVAVRIIIEREEEIEKFVPEEYWKLAAKFNKENMEFEAGLSQIDGKKQVIASEAEMKEILDMLGGSSYQVLKVLRKDKKKNPNPPYTTSSLQQDASRKLGFSAKKTMRFAQQLYEGIDLGKSHGGTVGLITYIRTDSTRISSQAQNEAKLFIEEHYGKEYLPEKTRVYASKKNAQDAHEAIRPTYVDKAPELLKDILTKDQYKLYKLIWTRFVCSQMASAIIDSLSVDIGAGKALFKANGSRVKFLGYLNLDKDARKALNEIALPVLEVDEMLNLSELAPSQHFTQPPARFNEASLVKTLEEMGIGRPSTYATIIDTIVRRGYIVKESKLFYSTELGRIVLDVLQSSFTTVLDPTFTAKMESNLDSVEEGTAAWKEVLKDFYGPFSTELEKAEKEVAKIEIKDEVSDVICEKCGRNMVFKMGRYGKFLACPGFPECRNTKPIIIKTGKTCPKCGGEVIEKKSRTGKTFYGCEQYPNCDFVSWDLPIEEKCPKCGYPLAQKSKRYGGYKYCLSEDCDYSEQKKKENKKDKKEE